MKLTFLSLLLVISVSLHCQTGEVVRIKDGDTIVVLDADNVQHTVRVADIDCPEYRQPFSNSAKQFVSDEIFRANVEIIPKGTDRYGRTIGYVMYGDGKDLSRELLINGLAWHYVKYSDSPTFGYLEKLASEKGRGLWADKNPIAPWNWRDHKRN